ncbi:unnamed protein product [Nippostrongylus brasiliensis]|uniref:FAD_binding_2 domain-containing protein n=1 Tax=Nippostrongylus brasiliensis TaxID=27835 RepID=A0A0N4XNB2_NIPBR|nr:unnamed protein product [Nippostrongylus brasiliensis]
MTDTRVVGLTSWNAYVTGVNIVQNGKRSEVNGKAVVLTTGGFSADKDEDASLLREFANDKAMIIEAFFVEDAYGHYHPFFIFQLRFPTTNGAFARGDGVKMARAMGAQVCVLLVLLVSLVLSF